MEHRQQKYTGIFSIIIAVSLFGLIVHISRSRTFAETAPTPCSPEDIVPLTTSPDGTTPDNNPGKANCSTFSFEAEDTSVDYYKESAFKYTGKEGERISCLDKIVQTALEKLVEDLAKKTKQEIDEEKIGFTVTDQTNGNVTLDTRKWADDEMVKQTWYALLRNTKDSGCPSDVYTNMNTCIEANYAALKKFIYCQDNAKDSDDFKLNNGDQPGNGFGGAFDKDTDAQACNTGQITLTEDCQMVPKTQVEDLCGNLTYQASMTYNASTPISLVFDDNYDINKHTSIVELPLNPYSEKAYWVWKGSEKTPLLVYDPEHKGVVNSAAQLFGNWTFGGKQTAALVDTKAPAHWRNGFEALATLDANYDGEISGEELKDLALWFDKNQDAISQEGEVVNIKETGIKALFYKTDREDVVNHTIEADKGFAREVNGKTVYGKAIDWSAGGADSQFDILSKHFLSREGGSQEKNNPNEDIVSRNSGSSPVTGIWKWTLRKDINALGESGYFLLYGEGGQLRGTTLMQAPIAVNDGTSKRTLINLSFTSLKGAQQVSSRGGLQLSFTTNTPNGRVENTATMDAAMKQMNGYSVATFTGDDGKRQTLKYYWDAAKLK